MTIRRLIGSGTRDVETTRNEEHRQTVENGPLTAVAKMPVPVEDDTIDDRIGGVIDDHRLTAGRSEGAAIKMFD